MNNNNKNIGLNALLNVIRQGLNVLFPLITYPYALRVLGVESLGKVNYSSSIVGYFSLIAMLGITNYAIREGARKKNNKPEFESFTSQIFTINLVSTLLSYLLLLLLITFFHKFDNYKSIILIQSISIILTTLGVDWINSVFEDYLMLTLRTIVTNVVILVFLFVFVKNENDYCTYALLTVISNGIVCISNLFHCRKYTRIKITRQLNLKEHIKPIAILFANAIAVTIYVNVDITMLGLIKGDYSVGLYSAAVKIYNIAKNIMAAIYVVSVPRLSFYSGSKKWKDYKDLCTNVFSSISLLLLPFGIGLVCLSSEVIQLIGGEEYNDSALTLRILGFSLIVSIFGGFLTAAINISLKRENITLLATVFSAIINVILNLVFIPLFGCYGAAATTLISELFVLIFCYIKLPNKSKYIEYRKAVKNFFTAFLGSIPIVLIYIICFRLVSVFWIRILFVFFLSIICYLIVLAISKNELLYSVIKKIKSNKS